MAVNEGIFVPPPHREATHAYNAYDYSHDGCDWQGLYSTCIDLGDWRDQDAHG